MPETTIQLNRGQVTHHDNFISHYEGCFTDDNIQEFLDHYLMMEARNQTYKRSAYDTSDRLRKDDSALALGTMHKRWSNIDEGEYAHFNQFMGDWMDYMHADIIPSYCAYWMDELTEMLWIHEGKVQKTRPGEGYHIWHTEVLGKHASNRVLAFSIYLNDVEKGGETEFLHQHVRFKPKRGDMLIWPGYFTHVHRGNPPLSGDKYICTGWVEYK